MSSNKLEINFLIDKLINYFVSVDRPVEQAQRRALASPSVSRRAGPAERLRHSHA